MTAQANQTQPKAFLGQSPAIQRLREQVEDAAHSGLEVLLTGEMGTGKRLAAVLLHQQGPRRDRPLIRLRRGNLAIFLEQARRHAYEQHPGSGSQPPLSPWFQTVQGSTLLLEDVGEWSDEEQRGITGILRCRTKEKVGDLQDLEVDVQIIATTRTDLEPAVRAGRFWPDLYYRLHGFPIVLPPLRDHREDIPLLAEHFLAQLAAQLQRQPCRLSPQALERMLRYQWPDNVRELRHCLEQAALLAVDGQIEPHHLWIDKTGRRTA